MDQRDYWNQNLDAANIGGKVSAGGESLEQELLFSGVPDVQQMIAAMPCEAGRTILEIGTGLGANAVLLSGRGATVIAMDLSSERLALMKERVAAIGGGSRGLILPVQARAEALPFKEGSLDGACSRAVLIHTQLEKTCAEVNRALKPGGAIAFSEPMAHNPFVNLYRATLAPKEWRTIATYFTQKEFRTVAGYFEGFQVRRFYVMAFLAFVFQYALPRPSWFYEVLHRLTAVDSFFEKRMARYGRYSWFALMTGRKPGAP